MNPMKKLNMLLLFVFDFGTPIEILEREVSFKALQSIWQL
jgi:hypothetical protein